MKDLRYFCDNKNEIDQMYPYERAKKFNQSIRKLGITDEGLSYLDLFRRLISHIGKSLLHVISELVHYMLLSGFLGC